MKEIISHYCGEISMFIIIMLFISLLMMVFYRKTIYLSYVVVIMTVWAACITWAGNGDLTVFLFLVLPIVALRYYRAHTLLSKEHDAQLKARKELKNKIKIGIWIITLVILVSNRNVRAQNYGNGEEHVLSSTAINNWDMMEFLDRITVTCMGYKYPTARFDVFGPYKTYTDEFHNVWKTWNLKACTLMVYVDEFNVIYQIAVGFKTTKYIDLFESSLRPVYKETRWCPLGDIHNDPNIYYMDNGKDDSISVFVNKKEKCLVFTLDHQE